jgi:hypothetical protein
MGPHGVTGSRGPTGPTGSTGPVDRWPDVRELLGMAATLTRLTADDELRNVKPPPGWAEALARACAISWTVASLGDSPTGTPRLHLHSEAREARLQLNGFDEFVSPGPYRVPKSQTAWTTPTSLAVRSADVALKITERDHGHRSVWRSAATDSLASLTIAEDRQFQATKLWQFASAAGRLPKTPDDDDLFAAFEAAILADAHEFATHLARHGFGVVAG